VDKAEAARAEAVGEGETEGAPTTDPHSPHSDIERSRPCSLLSASSRNNGDASNEVRHQQRLPQPLDRLRAVSLSNRTKS
jgi:hypothetical protein